MGRPRHLRPREAAQLLGVADLVNYSDNLRADLSLLGPVSSPMQCIWVAAHLIQNAAMANKDIPYIQPQQALQTYQQTLLNLARPDLRQSHCTTLVVAEQDTQAPAVRIKTFDLNIEEQLTSAARVHQAWGTRTQFTLDRISPDEWRTIYLDQCNRQKAQVTPKPEGEIKVCIWAQGHKSIVTIPTGSFVFETLHRLDLPSTALLIDSQGGILAPDTRLWSNTAIAALTPESFPTLRRSQIPVANDRGNGDTSL